MTMATQPLEQLALYRTTYDRATCKTGIVHIGYGAFHRAHQAIYVDDYMEQTGDLNWGIAAVNLRPSEAQSFAQSGDNADGYLIKTIAANGNVEMRLVRSHIDYLDWTAQRADAEQVLCQPSTHVATITVTESGYYLDGNGNLDTSDLTIANEINGGESASIYGYLAQALSKRMDVLNQPICILCCDNIRSNGKMLEKNFLSYLDAAGMQPLSAWVKSNVSFPCSMVDRITPRATQELQEEISSVFGNNKLDPIHAEAFTQWVLEKNFAATMPDLTKVGVEFVEDVDPFEEAKIRILNGGHTGLAYLGALAGYQTFDEAMRDPKLRAHFDGFEKLEVLPGLTLDLPFDKFIYLDEIADRFGNRAIADQLERICMDGFSKMQIYIRPTLASCLAQNIKPIHSYDCVASWYVYARRFSMGSIGIPYHEPYWDVLSPLLENGQEEAFARTEQLWGDLPNIYPDFVSDLTDAISKMEKSWPA